jgi:hypothetical protein
VLISRISVIEEFDEVLFDADSWLRLWEDPLQYFNKEKLTRPLVVDGDMAGHQEAQIINAWGLIGWTDRQCRTNGIER